MKDQILKIAGVKSEKEFYKKYPSEEAFMKAHKKEFKKAAMGASMVKKQLSQLTDFGNPPEAQNGMAFGDLLANANATNAGVSRKQYDVQNQQALDAQNAQTAANSKNSMSQIGQIGDLVNNFANTQSTNSKLNSAGMQLGDIMSGTFKRGGHLPIAQGGGGFDFTGLGNAIGTATQKQGGLGSALANATGFGGGADSIAKNATSSLGGGASAAGMGILNAAPQILQGIGQMKEQKQNIKKADQMSQISGLTAQAAESRPERVKNKYVRPEDSLIQPGQLGSPTGTGTNFLAQYGAQIGGNPTEIQNTYNPGDLYNDLGYEPLNDSNVKQYRRGGNLPKASFGLSTFTQNSGQASIGKGVGSAVGSIFGPVGSMVGGLLGTGIGNLLGGEADANKLQTFQDETKANTEKAAWAAGSQAMQAQNKAFMEDGGWVSNDWQPQTITTFGEHKLKDLLKPPHDADMLRAGGHLKEYTPPSATAMQTYEYGGQMAMGGDLQVHEGRAETISHNPYLPEGGETVMFRGPSHANGGMDISYGQNGVEVQGGEPAVKLQDGGDAGSNIVVYGGMQVSKDVANAINLPKAAGKKYQNVANDISKREAKYNKIQDRSTDLINDANTNDPFDKLRLNSGHAGLIGANMVYGETAEQKKELAIHQNAILDTAKERGLDSDALAKGKIKPMKKSDMAKFGIKMKKAQSGYYDAGQQLGQIMGNSYSSGADVADARMQALGMGNTAGFNSSAAGLPDITVIGGRSMKHPYENIISSLPNLATPGERSIDPNAISRVQQKDPKHKSNWGDLATSLMYAIPDLARPTNQEPLDPSQLMGEQFALAHNQVEPVYAQTYQPMLDNPYDISLQDQVNAVDSQARAAIRASGNNPAAQAFIMSQAAEQKNKVLGEQMRINQAHKAQVYQSNRAILNDAALKNMGILDTQQVRQSQAKSKTKEETIAAINSINAKVGQKKLENKTLGIYENLYKYRFGDKGQAYNVNDPYVFNQPNVGSASRGTPAAPEGYEYETILKPIKKKNGGDIKARNGSIVKALKTL